MPFFSRKDKKPSDRVLDLKARVDALRAADDANRGKSYSLEHFLEGDDVLTGRGLDDDYTPQGFDPAIPPEDAQAGLSSAQEEHVEVNLEAELAKYLQRQEEMERAAAAASSFDPSPPAEPSIPREPPASARDWDRSIQDLAAQLQDFNDTAKEASSTDAVWSAEPDAIEEPEQLHPEIDWSNSSWPSEDDWPEDVKKAI